MNKHGYVRVRYKGKRTTAQRVIYLEAYGSIPLNWEIHHINGNPRDNRLTNLMALSRPDHERLHTGNYRHANGRLFKKCIKCDRFKPVDRFYLSFQPEKQKGRYVPYSYSSRCKPCRGKQVSAAYKKHLREVG